MYRGVDWTICSPCVFPQARNPTRQNNALNSTHRTCFCVVKAKPLTPEASSVSSIAAAECALCAYGSAYHLRPINKQVDNTCIYICIGGRLDNSLTMRISPGREAQHIEIML